ncbi:putative flippase GtrA [Prauserella shujinwangii]|uniref:Putative flippase GtrA n=1 Tax=Prauserella shujinwangii TaxID=1453103 RepID=A0A2T0M0V9_9PSEU|nr:GtrA family protein [Prauserella shujinwangii]PRX50218.1 putative flippase GtrA [Prauserella shujinwangii]
MADVTTGSATPEDPRGNRPRGIVRLARAATSSLLATGISQLTLLVLLSTQATGAGMAAALAFVAGAVPNYLVARKWAWGRRGKPRVRGELLPYLAVIATGGLTAVGATKLGALLIAPLDLPHVARVLVLDAAYISSYALVFLMKFALLDRLVFAGAVRTRAATSQS